MDRIAKEIPVLMYHHLLKDNENIYKDNKGIMSVEKFEEQMKILHENDFNTITLEEMEKFIRGEIYLPEKSILITFDDSCKSYYVYAYPILKKYLFKAIIFTITSNITDEPVPFDPIHTQSLSWKEINRSRDVFEFASHTHALHRWDHAYDKGYLITKPKEYVIRDFKKSMKMLETKCLAYPFGHYDKETLKILKDLGFSMAFTIHKGNVKPKDNMFELKRNGISRNTSTDEFKRIIGIN